MITALVGGQFGSEGKGLIAGHIGRLYGHHVRVGAANAGHTVYTDTDELYGGIGPKNSWEKHVLQQIPCAAYANPEADLYIGPGALISPGIFLAELDTLTKWRRAQGLKDPLVYVDRRAHVIQQEHVEREQESALAERIGSTSTIAKEGIGAAQAARAMRDESCVLARYAPELERDDIYICNVPMLLNNRPRDTDYHLLLEGTQGYGLSLTTGEFPYVTSRNTTAAGLAADCGVPPNHIDNVIAVMRTFPIRVAGNSGPFHHGSEEISWELIGIDPENERTTVTKNVRRVATFSYEQAWESCQVNGATEIALTFADYLDPEIFGLSGAWWRNGRDLANYPRVKNMVADIEEMTDVRVTMLGTGPTSVVRLQCTKED